jgi:hypothetical protein
MLDLLEMMILALQHFQSSWLVIGSAWLMALEVHIH